MLSTLFQNVPVFPLLKSLQRLGYSSAIIISQVTFQMMLS